LITKCDGTNGNRYRKKGGLREQDLIIGKNRTKKNTKSRKKNWRLPCVVQRESNKTKLKRKLVNEQLPGGAYKEKKRRPAFNKKSFKKEKTGPEWEDWDRT